MKDYETIVVWLDYFNKTITRAKGRRLTREQCIFDPSLLELETAGRSAGLTIVGTESSVRFPRRPYTRSGYIAVSKSNATKSSILAKISSKLVEQRAKQKKKIAP